MKKTKRKINFSDEPRVNSVQNFFLKIPTFAILIPKFTKKFQIHFFSNSKIRQSPNNNNIVTCKTATSMLTRGEKCPGVDLSQAPKRLEGKKDVWRICIMLLMDKGNFLKYSWIVLREKC